MEIKRLNDNQIRCAITEQEIEEMGFRIDDIIGNTEETQKFMHMVLEIVEEQEQLDVELTSPIVRAELLPDHSMTITFGGISEEEKKSLFDRMMQIMDSMKKGPGISEKEEITADKAAEESLEEECFEEPTPFALEFSELNDVIRMSKCLKGEVCIPESALYKMEGNYYLLTDFIHFSQKTLQPFAFAALEHDNRHYASGAVIAHIKEHGKCLLAGDAIKQLMQL